MHIYESIFKVILEINNHYSLLFNTILLVLYLLSSSILIVLQMFISTKILVILFEYLLFTFNTSCLNVHLLMNI